ncbi:MAG: hypothetical protein ABI552_06670 [Casimicrobiaceae bacterium]
MIDPELLFQTPMPLETRPPLQTPMPLEEVAAVFSNRQMRLKLF